MTYVDKNLRAFLDATAITPLRRRSEGRLKAYLSTEDVRAWNYTVEDRRRQILDIVRRDIDRCDGNLLKTIIEFLRNKYLDEIKKCCKMMWMFVNQLELTDEDQTKLSCLQHQLGGIFTQVMTDCTCADVGVKCICDLCSRAECTCGMEVCVCGVEEDIEIPEGGNPPPQDNLPRQSYKVQATGPVKMVTKVSGIKPGQKPGIQPGLQGPCECVALKAQVGSKGGKGGDDTLCTDGKGGTPGTSRPSRASRPSGPTRESRPSGPTRESRPSGTTRDSRPSTPTSPSRPSSSRPSSAKKPPVYDVCSLFEHTPTKEDIRIKKIGVDILRDSENSIQILMDALEERKNLCQQQQKNISNLKNERDKLTQKVEDCLKDLEKLKQADNTESPVVGSEEMENKIKTELEALKQYCWQLKETEAENEKLRRDKDILKRKCLSHPTFPKIEEKEKDQKLNEITKERDLLMKKVKSLEDRLQNNSILPKDLIVYKDCSTMLDNTLAERDEMLKNQENIEDIKKELEMLRSKSERVDELENELKSVKNKSNDFEVRRAKSDCVCLEKEVANLKAERDVLRKRIDVLTGEQDFLRSKAKETEIMKVERDKLQIAVTEMAHIQIHNENLRLKCKSLENASNEAYLYKHKYEELLVMQCDCQKWKSEIEAGEHVKKERDCLRKQVADLETVIVDQESEIRRLMSQFEKIIKHKDRSQIRMREALVNMRNQIEKKDTLIAISEEKLEKVQTELKSSIQGVSCETICYKTRLEELEKELKQAKDEIIKLENQFSEKFPHSDIEYDKLAAMRTELEATKAENEKLQELTRKMAAITGDEHVQKMLKHSESAIRKVVTELSKQYKEWDHYKEERRRSRSRSNSRSPNQTTLTIGYLEAIHNKIHSRRQKRNQDHKYSKICQGQLSTLKLRNEKI